MNTKQELNAVIAKISRYFDDPDVSPSAMLVDIANQLVDISDEIPGDKIVHDPTWNRFLESGDIMEDELFDQVFELN